MAVEQGRRLWVRCREAAGTTDWFDPQRSRPEAELWGLPVYAIAGETGQDVATVSPAQLRYRLDDQDGYSMWLCAQLQRMGHHVAHPTPPKELRCFPSPQAADQANLTAATALSTAMAQWLAPTSDDPVARLWRHISVVTAEATETTDGTLVADALRSRLWTSRRIMVTALDHVLILERGGWPAGTRVRTRGIPHYISASGTLAGELGLAGDRAVVDAPYWTLDHSHRTLTDGPPTGYDLRYRSLTTGLATSQTVGPIAAGHLTLDLAPFPDLSGNVRTPPPVIDAPTPSRTVPAVDRAPRGSGDQPAPPSTHTAGAGHDDEPDAVFRRAALARLWELRDRELRLVGDSTPVRLAERIVAGTAPAPPDPPTSRALDMREQDTTWEAPLRSPTCPPDRQLVTGERRELLTQWLREVVNYWTTAKQREVLDGFHGTLTLADARRILAEEGFVEVLDVHGNADTASSGDIDLILLNPDCGWLAAIHAADDGRGTAFQSIHVWFNAEILDEDMMINMNPGGGWGRDEQQRRTNIWRGAITVTHHHTGTGSLRVKLAVLRAFGRPVLPWRYPVSLHIGRDDASRTETNCILAALPQHVRDLLGPMNNH